MDYKRNIGQKGFSQLRMEAEQVLGNIQPENMAPEGKDIKALFQELQVHQLELEMQNDELYLVNGELESERLKFRSVYDLAPIGYFILDTSGVIEEVNNAALTLVDSYKAGVIYKRFQIFVSPEATDNYYKFFRQLLNSEDKQTCQLKMVSKSGRSFYAQVEGIAINSQGGNKMQCYITVTDITQRILTTQQLTDTNKRLELALNASVAGTWEFDCNTKRLYLDEYSKRVCNVEAAGFDNLYPSFLNHIEQADRDMVIIAFNEAMRYGHEIDINFRVIRTDGNVSHVSLRGQLIESPEFGRRLTGIMMNITEKKLMEEETLRLKKEQERRVVTAQLKAEENERRRISESLHDSVSQLLYGIKIQVEQIKASNLQDGLNHLNELLSLAIKETRNISFELAPSILSDFGLPTTIDELAKRLSTEKFEIVTKFVNMGCRLDPLMESSIFRIIQELVNNCMKHAKASLINIEVRKNKMVEIVVKDNGKGFDVEMQKASPAGAGLSSIRSRLNLYCGSLQINSKPGQGTTVKVCLKC